MPWREVWVKEQREEMVLEALAGRRSMAEIAEQYEVTRKTLYKWMERYGAHGREGLRLGEGEGEVIRKVNLKR